jgi:hypothetical protein
MKRSATVPEDLDLVRLRSLLSGIDRRDTLGARIEAASRQLLGRPYLAHPLVGSAQTPEVFTVSLGAFDCVTYVETVLGLALALTTGRFVERVRQIRYRDGCVEWAWRSHYMTGWIRNNARAGFLRRVALPAPSVVRARTLDAVPGLPPRRLLLRCLPKRAFWRVRAAVHTGDVLCFASTRKDLDAFHAGFAVWSGGELRLRHASLRQGRVVEQALAGFLKDNTMAGVIVARPVEPRNRAAARARGMSTLAGSASSRPSARVRGES